jgi:symplekin
VFSSIVTTPPQTFGSVTSNLPRVRQSELLTPAELMVLLHYSEKEIGVKSAMEGKSSWCLRSPFFYTHVFDSYQYMLPDDGRLPV